MKEIREDIGDLKKAVDEIKEALKNWKSLIS